MTLLFVAMATIVFLVLVDELGQLRGHGRQIASASASLKSLTIDLDDRER